MKTHFSQNGCPTQEPRERHDLRIPIQQQLHSSTPTVRSNASHRYCFIECHDQMPFKDAVSWNDMLFGYAQSGYAIQSAKGF